MTQCGHENASVSLGPAIVIVTCLLCKTTEMSTRYGLQKGQLVRMPTWADNAYLRAIKHQTDQKK